MPSVTDEKQTYRSEFERFEQSLPASERSAFHRLRQGAIARFAAVGFPTTRDEEWRFTNLTPFVKVPFQLASPDTVESLLFPTANRLVFINGRYSAKLSRLPALPAGVIVTSLAHALSAHRELVERHLGHHARYENSAFTALNTAFLHDGAFVYLPQGKVVEQPIYLVFLTTPSSDPVMTHPRNLIVAGPASQVTLVESYAGPADAVYLTNSVTEVVAGESAVIDHYKLQEESLEAFHVSTLQIYQQRGSNFSSHGVNFGGLLVRNDVNAVIDAEGCECTLNGLYMGRDEQLIDNHTRIDHAKANCASHELYKGILDNKARGVFNGKIYVHQDAQKTDAKQTNQTLLLSDDATINTKPQLEIYADDVKCTHGATVGQLDAESLYYLRSRGIGLNEARRILTFAFANDVVRRIKIEALREKLERRLLEAHHLATEPSAGEVP